MQNQPMQDTFIEKPSSAANETLEDYTLRYAPYSFRRWSPKVVAITALGGIGRIRDSKNTLRQRSHYLFFIKPPWFLSIY